MTSISYPALEKFLTVIPIYTVFGFYFGHKFGKLVHGYLLYFRRI